jgi:hypothetical protein
MFHEWFAHLQETWLGDNVSWFAHLQETWLGTTKTTPGLGLEYV